MVVPAADLALLSRLLDEAMDLPPAERESWLGRLPEGERHLAEALREMLVEKDRAQMHGFLASLPAIDGTPDGDDAIAYAGEPVGAYRLIREIGRGGMGEVWLAERADGAFARQVALKLPRLAWGAGLAQRMAREREIGALLEHPNIARLYDAGVDPRGRPYMALEYIEGHPIDAWCGERVLDVRARLRLFLQVARAVAYAHGRLVVHRDLKPSNVLVSADGQAHLLDFGIAKRLGDGVASDPALTQEHGRLMTPQYASPEQIAGEAITVQSDVYSLGVLLYELLTGRLPHARRRASLGAVEDAILHGDTRPASSQAGDPALMRALRGEIDAILAKALERDPARRYPTVDALVDDIERFLNGRTVSARSSSRVYRWRKAARRQWVALSAAASVMLAVLSGSGVAIVQAQRANAEAERSRLVNEFVVQMFDAHGGPEGSLTQIPAQVLLERGARQIETKFAGQPLLQAQLYGVVSRMYFNLSVFDKSVDFGTHQVEALASAGEQGRPLAEATLSLGESLIDLWRWGDAQVRLRRAIALSHDEPDLLVRAHAQLAFVLYFGLNQVDAAARELDAADAVMARHAVPPLARANARFVRAVCVGGNGALDEALPLFDEAIRLSLQAEGPTSRTAMHARTAAGAQLVFAHRANEARPYVDAAIATMRSVGGPDDARAAVEESRFTSWMYLYDGATPFAEVVAKLEHDRQALASSAWAAPARSRAEVDIHLGVAYLRWGDFVRGESLVSQALPACFDHAEGLTARSMCLAPAAVAAGWTGAAAESDAASERYLSESKMNLAGFDLEDPYLLRATTLMHARRYAEARAVLDEFDVLPGVVQARTARRSPALFDWDDVRIVTALELGRFDEVLAMSAHPDRKMLGRYADVAFVARASALCATNRPEEGLALFSQALPALAVDRSDTSPLVAYWRARMGLCAWSAGRLHLAHEAYFAASAALAAQRSVSPHLSAPARDLEGKLDGGTPASH